MNRNIVTALAILGLWFPQAASAGEAEKKVKKGCTAEAQSCVHGMVEHFKNRGWIGIEMDRDKDRQIITKVVQDSPAERAGLLKGDAIVTFNNVSLSEEEEVVYAEMKKALIPGKIVSVGIERDGSRRNIDVTLSSVPQQLLAQWIGQHMIEQHADKPEKGEAPEAGE